MGMRVLRTMGCSLLSREMGDVSKYESSMADERERERGYNRACVEIGRAHV